MDVPGFNKYIKTKFKSEETQRAYRQAAERFEAYLKLKNLKVNKVKPSQINEFIEYIKAHKGRTVSDTLSPATIGRMLCVISKYYKWSQLDSDLDKVRNPVVRVERPRMQNQNVEYRAIDEKYLTLLINGINNLRDRAIVLLFLDSGLRLSELGRLNKTTMAMSRKKLPDGTYKKLPDGTDQYFGTGEVVGKRNKIRMFMAGPQAVAAVKAYFKECKRLDDSEDALFLSSRKQRISDRTIQQIVDKWCKRLDLPHMCVHALRHSFATRQVKTRKMSLPVLRKFLGHDHLSSTGRYIHVDVEQMSSEYISAMQQKDSAA